MGRAVWGLVTAATRQRLLAFVWHWHLRSRDDSAPFLRLLVQWFCCDKMLCLRCARMVRSPPIALAADLHLAMPSNERLLNYARIDSGQWALAAAPPRSWPSGVKNEASPLSLKRFPAFFARLLHSVCVVMSFLCCVCVVAV